MRERDRERQRERESERETERHREKCVKFDTSKTLGRCQPEREIVYSEQCTASVISAPCRCFDMCVLMQRQRDRMVSATVKGCL